MVWLGTNKSSKYSYRSDPVYNMQILFSTVATSHVDQDGIGSTLKRKRYIELYENILGEKFVKADVSNIYERIENNVLAYLTNK